MKPSRILLIDAGFGTGKVLKDIGSVVPGNLLEVAEVAISCPASEQESQRLSEVVNRWSPDVLVLFLSGESPVQTGAIFFELAFRNKWVAPIIALCPTATPENAGRLLSFGASDVVTIPSRLKEVIRRLLTVHTRDREEPSLASLQAQFGLGHLIGECPAFVAVIKQILSIAKYKVSVLILGETGTGKEIFARAIHYRSQRSSKPFIPVNCGAIPVDLLENEFFGHEAGAFTSANSPRRGVIKEADGGTLFLDEVDCLPPFAQVKLLRFLQDGQFRPLGSASTHTADVRVIAASNTNFAEALESGRFRRDLYYRLNVLSLTLPPLRERDEDLFLLARYFLSKYRDKFEVEVREFSPEALFKLSYHTWPGNVRELENVVQRAIVLADHELVREEDIRTENTDEKPEAQTFRQLKAKAVEHFERTYLRRLLTVHKGNITKAAYAAGKDRRAFWELMRKHHIIARSLC